MVNKPIFIFGARNDSVVPIDKYVKLTDYWFRSKNAKVKTVYENFEHIYPNNLPVSTYNPNVTCATLAGASGGYMSNCGYDLAGKYLKYIYGDSFKPWNLEYN